MEQFLIQMTLLVIGFILLVKGADFFVDGAAGVAAKLGIPQLVIGLTIVAFGTSAPEAAVSLTAAFQGNAAITIGNVVGSNILNVLVILGLTSMIIPLHVKMSTARFEMPFVILASIALAVLGLFDNLVGPADGLILWIGMILFLAYLFWLTKKGEGESVEIDSVGKAVWLLCIMIAGGMALIIIGSHVSVNAATKLAQLFGVDDRIIGLTIVALGTSLPELVTSVTAGLKGNADIAVGNIVGSNIFNILFIVGTTALITPITYSSAFLIDSLAAIGSAVLLWVLAAPKRTLGRAGGAVMLLSYGAYLAYLL